MTHKAYVYLCAKNWIHVTAHRQTQCRRNNNSSRGTQFVSFNAMWCGLWFLWNCFERKIFFHFNWCLCSSFFATRLRQRTACIFIELALFHCLFIQLAEQQSNRIQRKQTNPTVPMQYRSRTYSQNSCKWHIQLKGAIVFEPKTNYRALFWWIYFYRLKLS